MAGTYLDGSVIVVLPPSGGIGDGKRRKGPATSNGKQPPPVRWNKEANFHPDLKADDHDGLVLQFQAKARDSIGVLLSTKPDFDWNGPVRYEIVLGGTGDTVTTIRRRAVRQETSSRRGKTSESVEWQQQQQRRRRGSSVSTPSRVCRDDAWVSYWVCLCRGSVYVGIGTVPGRDCIVILEDDAASGEQEQRQASEDLEGGIKTEYCVDESGTARAVNQKTENEGDGAEEVVKTDDSSMDETPAPVQYVGIGNGSKHVLQLQHILVTNLPPLLETVLSELPSQDDLDIVVVPSRYNGDSVDPETAEWKQLMQEYKRECQTRKARAAKYGMEYSEPPPDAFLPWSKAKRLRENPEKGFITGLDLMDPKEVAKREARMARFGDAGIGVDAASSAAGAKQGEASNDETEESQQGRSMAVMDTALGSSRSSEQDLPIDQAWDKEQMLRPLRTDPPKYLWKKEIDHQGDDGTTNGDEAMEQSDPFATEKPKLATFVPEKVHLCAIDWAAFKQIRNNDIMAYFSGYGPSYVEWLGDLSCNVCFEDKYTASRVLLNLSNEIPSPPPETVLKACINDGIDADGMTVAPSPPDLGRMTWRLGKQAIRKVANDRHGRRGTTARILMRAATSKDTLEERPNSWPAPPGGFSSTDILGPDSDHASKKQKEQHERGGKSSKSKRQREDIEAKDRHKRQPKELEDAESLMNRGLSSGRGGFTVEEMEMERTKKKQKIAESS